MRLKDLNELVLRQVSDAELLHLHSRTHKAWNEVRNAATDHRMGKLTQLVLDRHRKIVDELRRRGLKFELRDDELDRDIPSEKIISDFGVFERNVLTEGKWLVRLSADELARARRGDLDKIPLPPDQRPLLPVTTGEVLVISDGQAHGRLFVSVESDGLDVRNLQPFVKPVGISGARNDRLLRPDSVKFRSQPIEKQRKVALAFVYNQDDEVLIISRRFPPLVWGAPGGFIKAGETPCAAARREVMEETGVEMASCFETRSGEALGIPETMFVVGRTNAKKPGKLSREVKEAKFVALEDLTDYTPLSPRRGSFRRSFNDLVAFEAQKVEEELPDTADISPALLGGLTDTIVRRIDEELHDRFMPFAEVGSTSEEIVNAHIFVLQELKDRDLKHPVPDKDDPLNVATAKLQEKIEKGLTKVEGLDIHQARVKLLCKGLPENVLVVQDWANLTGSFIYARGGRKPNDIDVVFKQDAPLGDSAALKFQRAILELTGIPPQFIMEPIGANWPHVPLYDLVAVKKEEIELRAVREDFWRFVKQRRLVQTRRGIRPGVPFEVWKAAGEYYQGNFDELLEWGEEQFDGGNKSLEVQTKFDGFRMLLHRSGDRAWLFTEGGRDRIGLFPELKNWALRHPVSSFILDTEFVPFEGRKVIPRQEGIWMIVGKERPPGMSARIFVHDAVWSDGRNIAGQPYSERRKVYQKLVPRKREIKPDSIEPAQTSVVNTRTELEAAVRRFSRLGTSEGAMIKASDFLYEPAKRISGVVKFKNLVEIDAEVIGWRKVPAGRPPGKRWTSQQAMANLPKFLRDSRTYVLRASIRDRGKRIPIEADKKLTPADVNFKWNEEKQRWEGTDDPAQWRMCPGFKQRRQGERAYGVTFSVRIDEGPKCGDIITVAPGAIQELEDPKGLAWTFPKIVEFKPEGRRPGQLRSILEAFRRARPEFRKDDEPIREAHECCKLVVPIEKQPPEFFEYPDGTERAFPFVYHHHYRGRSLHADLRLSKGKFLTGWTLSTQVRGKPKEEVETLSEARAQLRDVRAFKINPKTGMFALRRIRAGEERPTEILSFPKAPQPLAWLKIEGVTKPGEVGATREFTGVFLIVDEGDFEFGALKSSIFEIFFKNAKLFPTRRHFWRPLRLGKEKQEFILAPSEEQDISETQWLMIQPTDQLPNVLAKSSREERPWIPPRGWSALPSELRKKVPPDLRYWTKRTEKDRMKLRNELFEKWKEEGVIGALREGKDFDEAFKS